MSILRRRHGIDDQLSDLIFELMANDDARTLGDRFLDRGDDDLWCVAENEWNP